MNEVIDQVDQALSGQQPILPSDVTYQSPLKLMTGGFVLWPIGTDGVLEFKTDNSLYFTPNDTNQPPISIALSDVRDADFTRIIRSNGFSVKTADGHTYKFNLQTGSNWSTRTSTGILKNDISTLNRGQKWREILSTHTPAHAVREAVEVRKGFVWFLVIFVSTLFLLGVLANIFIKD
jgi:hypothetical protein